MVSKLKQKEKRQEKLASDIIDSMDMDTLVEYACDRMLFYLKSLTDEEFTIEYNTYYDAE